MLPIKSMSSAYRAFPSSFSTDHTVVLIAADRNQVAYCGLAQAPKNHL